MRDLLLSECRRFRNAALIFAGVHLLLQLFVHRMTDLLQSRWELHLLVLSVYMLAGLAFALYQFGSYRQGGRWIWLLHRPLPPRAIFAAVGLAASALILFAVGLPALLAVAGNDLLSSRTVDARHYVLVLHLVMLTLSAWLAGSYVILNRSRSAIVILLVPVLLVGHLASGFTMLLPAVLCVALLAFTASGAFKPDRMVPPSNPAMVAATAAPLMLGFYFVLLWGGSLVYQNAQIALGIHPLNIPAPPAGGFTESTRAEGKDLFLLGLSASHDPRAPQWRRQVPLLDVANFEPSGKQFPVRHQVSNLDTLQWVDGKRRIEWTFSHDTMRFHGRDTFTSHDRGTLGLRGIGDNQPFPAVPILPEGDYILTPQQLYRFDADSGAIDQLISLRAPETLARTPKLVGERLYVITNYRLIAYQRPAEDAAGPLQEAYSVKLPGAFSDLDRIDIAGLLDGSLISFSFGRSMIDGAGEAAQTIMLVDASGRASVVAKRQLAHDFTPLFEHHAWLVSPVLHAVHALPDALLDTGGIRDDGQSGNARQLWYPRPPLAQAAAALLSALSAAGAWFWLRRSRVAPKRKAAWIAACLLLGPPALLCLMVLQGRPPRRVATQASPTAVVAA
ncbi:hypothetical protein ACFSQU_16560 [Massilia sp. GCM10020059]|uniref:Uncharacterized protein n=1 Tax=Massilia agrisoli TaxID=2892444 RepID=A0ABS8IRV3_9BURK|nr:hypothetical protein [Massilia agrisoli]MCC6071151.1 hypothetical protein [Massilia agrisoli]